MKRPSIPGMIERAARADRGATSDAPEATLARPAAMRRLLGVLRRWSRLAIPDIYLLLAVALIRRHRFEEAAEAIHKALTEEGGIREDEALEDVVHAAREAGARKLEIWSQLELARRRPDRAEASIRRARELLDGDADADTRAIVTEWEQRAGDGRLPEPARYEAALLGACTALLAGDGEALLQRLADAAAIAPSKAAAGARSVLNEGPLPASSTEEAVQLHLLRARAFVNVNAPRDALKEAAAAIYAAPGSAPEDELSALRLHAELLEQLGPDSDTAAAYRMLGRTLDQTGDHVEAIGAFERAIKFSDDDALTWWYLADSRRLSALATDPEDRDFDVLRRARDDWATGFDHRVPTTDEAWVCAAGGLILERLASDPKEPDDLLWEALRCAEEAVLLNPRHGNAHAHLVRRHGWLDHPATALASANQALSHLSPNNLLVRECLTMLAEVGADDALMRVERYRQDLGTRSLLGADPALDVPWADGLRAYVLLYSGRAADAVHAFDACLVGDDRDAWALAHRSLARAAANDVSGARADATRVRQILNPRAPQSLDADVLARGWSEFLLGDLHDAARTFGAAAELVWSDPTESLLGLAATRLALGDQPGAAEAFAQAAARARHARHGSAARLATEVVARVYPAADVAEAARAFLPPRPLAELQFDVDEALAELDQIAADAAPGSTRWTVSVAARARLLSADERPSEAAAAYEQLASLETPPAGTSGRLADALEQTVATAITTGDAEDAARIRRRLIGLGRGDETSVRLAVAQAHRSADRSDMAIEELRAIVAAGEGPHLADAARLAGDILLAGDEASQAAESYRAALAATPADGAAARAELETRLGVAAAAMGDSATTLACFRTAFVILATTVGGSFAAQTVVRVASELAAHGQAPLIVPMALRELMQDRQLLGKQRRWLARERYDRLRQGATEEDRVAPLALEADWSLFPNGGADAAVVFMMQDSIPTMRRRLCEATGMEIPGVSVNGSDQLRDGRFNTCLHRVPYAGGRVHAGALLCTDPAACAELGLDGEWFGNAWDGERAGLWLLDPELRAVASEAALPLLGPHDAMLWSLEGRVRLLLFRLVGMTEVDEMVERWRLAGDVPHRSGLIDGALPDSAARIRFAAVVRRLVREQVPVGEMQRLLEAFALVKDGEPLTGVVEAARFALRNVLPGADGRRELIDVDDASAAAVADAAKSGRGFTRDSSLHLLGTAGTALAQRPASRVALVVANAERRPAVQIAAEAITRSAAVLSVQELPAQLTAWAKVGVA